jgi:hypothetical protein
MGHKEIQKAKQIWKDINERGFRPIKSNGSKLSIEDFIAEYLLNKQKDIKISRNDSSIKK